MLIAYIAILIVMIFAARFFRSKLVGSFRKDKIDLTGKTIIITGASAGIGKETAKELAMYNAKIIFACRNKEKTHEVMQEIQRSSEKRLDLHFMKLELSDYSCVRNFVKDFVDKFEKVDILINNAGTFRMNAEFNSDHHELVMASNHLGPFLLTELLIKHMTSQSRIINVSSDAHEYVREKFSLAEVLDGKQGSGFKIYAVSKFCNVMYTIELAERFENQKRTIKAVSLHPGFVNTEIFSGKNFSFIVTTIIKILFVPLKYFMLSENEGAQTTLYCALQPFEELVQGGYYQKASLSKSSKFSRSCSMEVELVQISRNYVGL